MTHFNLRKVELGMSTMVLSIAALVGCSAESKDEPISTLRQPLEVQCIDDAGGVPDSSWVCPDKFTVECDDPAGTDVATILSRPPEQQTCANVELTVSPKGPFGLGTHTVQISSSLADTDGGDNVLCQAELTVVDTTAPEVTAKPVELWPPNHKLRSISAQDCFEIKDRCDATVDATLLWVTSDEPANSTGDGNTEPDIKLLGCDRVQLRAERQGSGDGRVYRLGWRFKDDSGNMTEKVCEVVVPHDQGGRATAAADVPMVKVENDPVCQVPSPPDAGHIR
jgi:hypothetical protein